MRRAGVPRRRACRSLPKRASPSKNIWESSAVESIDSATSFQPRTSIAPRETSFGVSFFRCGNPCATRRVLRHEITGSISRRRLALARGAYHPRTSVSITLCRADGRAIFLDFEYAGWDDPAKLTCDFFCQPECRFRAITRHVRSVSRGRFPESARVVERSKVLFAVYPVKWVCIRLYAFLPVGLGRRQFALNEDLEYRKYRQLARARAGLADVLESERVVA